MIQAQLVHLHMVSLWKTWTKNRVVKLIFSLMMTTLKICLISHRIDMTPRTWCETLKLITFIDDSSIYEMNMFLMSSISMSSKELIFFFLTVVRESRSQWWKTKDLHFFYKTLTRSRIWLDVKFLKELCNKSDWV